MKLIGRLRAVPPKLQLLAALITIQKIKPSSHPGDLFTCRPSLKLVLLNAYILAASRQKGKSATQTLVPVGGFSYNE
jgi:hypothetical protein